MPFLFRMYDINMNKVSNNIYHNKFQNDRERRPIQNWSLVCDTQLSRTIKCGTIFQLRQGNDVSLLCQIQKLPHFNIIEGIVGNNQTTATLFNQRS